MANIISWADALKNFLRRLIANVAEPTEAVATDASAGEAESLIAEGQSLEDRGDPSGALAAFDRAVRIVPNAPRAHLNRGNALKSLGRFEEAESAFRKSTQLDPDYAAGHMNLGNLHLERSEFETAEAAYRAAIRCRPRWAEAWFGLGSALAGRARIEEAREALQSALEFEPSHGKAASRLSGLLVASGNTEEARRVLQGTLKLDPDNYAANVAMAEIEKNLGDCESAVRHYRKALASSPGNRSLISSFLFALNHLPGIGNEQILAEHLSVANGFTGRAARMPGRNAFDPTKKLRLGYVSPDFRRHSVSCFFEPLLRFHDRSSFSVSCYYNHRSRDDITHRFQSLSDDWCDTVDMSDDALARRIDEDGIDILVDLAGHTTGNRLGVFAMKPAPIQFTWLGYLCTSGLQAIDYRICDGRTDPLGLAELWQVETPARLPDSQWCYQPQVDLPDVSLLPRLENGYWTFGSFNQASKLNGDVLLAWARVLKSIVGSRLRIFGVTDPLHQRRILAAMNQEGINAERLDIVGRLPIETYFSSYGSVDIALDTFPYNGATTTCDALIMGVPVASVAGMRPISRGGMSLLGSLGLQDWVAESEDALVELIRAHVEDLEGMSVLRSTLPDRMRRSVLMDGKRFTENMEVIFRKAWAQACADRR